MKFYRYVLLPQLITTIRARIVKKLTALLLDFHR